LQATGVIDLPFFRQPPADTHAGKVPVPISAVDVAAYTMVTRDHLLDQTGAPQVIWMTEKELTSEMLTDLGKILGRVLRHKKQAGYAFREKDFLPEGTRPGMVAGIPPGKRSYTLDVNKIKGIQSLEAGDRFDLLATVPVDEKMARLPDTTQLVNSGNLVTPQKRATVKVIARDGFLVSPMTVRLIPVTTESLIAGS